MILALALLAGLAAVARPAPPQGWLSTTDWHGTGPLFGGFSAISVDPDGLGFVALSDHGGWVRGTLTRDATGRITAVTALGPVTRLKGVEGQPLGYGNTDSEGLARAADGSFYVSFEGYARVRRYPDLSGPAQSLPEAREFRQMKRNSALESVCVDAGGTVYTLPEEPFVPSRSFPVYRLAGDAWKGFGTIPKAPDFSAVDCSIGPDGRFYLLERAFHGISGFESRLRRFSIGADGLTDETLIFQSDLGTFDDIEGLSIWRDGQDALRATMVVDDNFSSFFSTQIVEFRLPD